MGEIIQILIAILITYGFIGTLSYGSMKNIYPWFNQLKKPSWNPPSWVIGPIWTFLYLSMAYASYRVYNAGNGFSGRASFPLIIYIINLIINGTYTQVIFNLHLIGASAIHIIVLLFVSIYNGILFYEIDHVAGTLFIPYVSWLSLASVLNFEIWRLNSS